MIKDTNKMLQVTIPKNLYKALDDVAKDLKTSKTKFIITLLTLYLYQRQTYLIHDPDLHQ